MYEQLFSSLGIAWDYHQMSPVVGRSTTDTQEHWAGTTLFLDSHIYQENRKQCQDGDVPDKRVGLGAQWANKSGLFAVQISSCSNLFPRLFPPHVNGTRTNSCGDFYRDDSDKKSQKAILCAPLESGQAERVHERFHPRVVRDVLRSRLVASPSNGSHRATVRPTFDVVNSLCPSALQP